MRQSLSTCFSHTLLSALLAIPIVIASVLAAPATTKEKAAELCMQALTNDHDAQNVRDISVHHHDGVPFVYGNADFVDAVGVHFRCRVYHEKVRTLRYLVNDPQYENGRAWSKERPRDAPHYDLKLDEAAMAPPPHNPATPHFERVPQ